MVKKTTVSLSQSPSSAAAASSRIEMWRFRGLWAFALLAFLLLIGRAFYVQVINKDFLQEKANSKILYTEQIQARRGEINDRNGIPLAISSPVMQIVIDPRDYFDNKKRFEEIMIALAEQPNNRKLKQQLPRKNLDLNALADALLMDRNTLIDKVYSAPKSRYLVLKKELPPQQAKRILQANFQGVFAEKTYKRYYPQPQANAQIIGLTNSEGKGIEGLERQFNQQLSGQNGKQKIVRDKRGNRLKVFEVIQPVQPGKSLELSIDSRLQYIMYRELAAVGISNNARSASAVAVDVKTGEVLAMSSWPSYNPNNKKSLNNKDAMRNRGAIDMFEPGSTVKPLTVAMAIESGKYTANSVINTHPGSMLVGNHTIRDTHNYGALTLGGIIVKSSNVGVARLALSLPYSTLPHFYQRMGFGQKTAIGFTGESRGLILPEKFWNQSEVATMSYGYGLNATVLQLAQSYMVLANHGVKVPLTLHKLDKPVQGQRVLDGKIADQVLLMMEGVTLPGGTATQANIPGYRVAGKTGTAHKLRSDGRGYAENEYRALFAGVAPVSNPRLAIVVVVENPQGVYYGGLVAAPVFARIAQESLRLLNVPLDKPLNERVAIKSPQTIATANSVSTTPQSQSQNQPQSQTQNQQQPQQQP